MVKRLRHGPFTAVTWVRFPYGSPKHPVSKGTGCFSFYALFKGATVRESNSSSGRPASRPVRTVQWTVRKSAGDSPRVIKIASVRGIAAQATAACGGNREPEQGQRPQRASPAQGAQPDAGAAARYRARAAARNQQSSGLLVSPREIPTGHQNILSLRGQDVFLFMLFLKGRPYGNRTARPAVLRPGRFGQSSGLSERAREIPVISKNIPGGLQAASTHGGEVRSLPGMVHPAGSFAAFSIARKAAGRGEVPDPSVCPRQTPPL